MARDFVPLPAGARGYLLGERSAQQAQQHEMGMLANLMELEGRRRAQLQEAALRSDIAALGPNPDPNSLTQVFAKYAHPTAALQSLQASADRRERIASAEGIARERIAAAEEAAKRKAEDDKAAREQAARDRENLVRLAAGLRPQPQPQAPVIVEIADPNNPTKAIKIDARTRQKIGDAPPKAPVERPLPVPLMNQFVEKGQILDSSERFRSTFQDEYGGFVNDTVGNAILQAERKNPFSQTTARTQWWQDYELHQSVVRNKLFGSALTAPEIKAWESSAITPGMNSANIRANLIRREKIERDGVRRLAKSASTQFNKSAIREALGRDLIDEPAIPDGPPAPPPGFKLDANRN